MTVLQLKFAIGKKRVAAKKITDACLSPNGEIREMTEDEKKAFDDLCETVASMKATMEKMADLESDDVEGVEEMEDEDKVETKSRRKSLPMGQAPAVHTRGDRPYSFLRAVNRWINRQDVDGLEGEVNRELVKLYQKEPKGFFMPLGTEPELRGLLKSSYPAREQRGDLTTSTGTGSVFVSAMLPFIELLRNKTVLKELGATILTGMDGKFSIPRQNLSPAAAWIAEGSALTANNQTLDQVAFVNKTLGGATLVTRKFISQTSIDAEQFVLNDLAAQLAVAFDFAGVNGAGTGAIPTGVMVNATVVTNSSGVQGGTNGLAPTYAQIVAMETQVASANADRGSLRYLMSPAARGKLKNTPKIGSTFPSFVWDDDEVNGYPAVASNQVPSNLTKGSGTALSGIIFGNWNDLVLAQWGGFDVVINPYSSQLSGGVQISLMTEADVQLRHPESFSVVYDAITT